MIIKSKDPKVKEDLEKALKEATLDDEYTIGTRTGGKGIAEDGTIVYWSGLKDIKPGDDGYLLALRARPVFCSKSLDDWEAGKGRKIGDYEMDCGFSRIVKEDNSEQKEYFICEKCGYPLLMTPLPEKCPFCNASKENFGKMIDLSK